MDIRIKITNINNFFFVYFYFKIGNKFCHIKQKPYIFHFKILCRKNNTTNNLKNLMGIGILSHRLCCILKIKIEITFFYIKVLIFKHFIYSIGRFFYTIKNRVFFLNIKIIEIIYSYWTLILLLHI